MKKFTVACVAFASVMAVAGTAAAQGKLGVDAAVVIPTGDWGDVAGIGIGGLVAGRYHLDPNLALTGRAGYIQHLGKDSEQTLYGTTVKTTITTSEIPILVGAKYYFDDMTGFYAGGELGWISMRAKVKTEGGGQSEENSDSNGRFAFTAGAGYEMDNIDFRGQLFIPNFLGREDGEDMQMGIMLNVGYRFMEF